MYNLTLAKIFQDADFFRNEKDLQDLETSENLSNSINKPRKSTVISGQKSELEKCLEVMKHIVSAANSRFFLRAYLINY